jgi:hypothetical protein
MFHVIGGREQCHENEALSKGFLCLTGKLGGRSVAPRQHLLSPLERTRKALDDMYGKPGKDRHKSVNQHA